MQHFNNYIIRNNMEKKPYQVEGIEWCIDIENNGRMINKKYVRGGILADEMGLGKTIQMIGLILSSFKKRTMIVVPRSLLEQWNSIIKKTLGHEVVQYHGLKAKKIDFDTLSNSPIVLTTYGMLSKYKEKPKKGEKIVFGELHELMWDRVIYDEAHHLRNRKTINHLAAVALKSSHTWLVTGTPIQNSMTDFYGLCAVLGIDQQFYTRRENIDILSRELILKRTKEDVGILLPELKWHNVIVEWEGDEERQLAEDIHAHLQFSRACMRENNSFSSLGMHYFAMIQKAKQSCIDMSMFKSSINNLVKLGIMKNDMSINKALTYKSKTNKVIKTLLERKDNGRAKLVFCHYHKEIDTIASRLTDCGINVATFDGRTKRSKRNEILTDKTINVLILQIRTGCEGLNLQQFSEVYFVSPNWNPAMEDQAVARCHRIGQTCETDVFSFTMTSFDSVCLTKSIDSYTTDIQTLKRLKMKELERNKIEKGDKLEDDCPICFDKQHENTIHKLKCGHSFHTECVNEWLKINASCPMCRKAV
jgi:SNF2 family DNA or RNA helicase